LFLFCARRSLNGNYMIAKRLRYAIKNIYNCIYTMYLYKGLLLIAVIYTLVFVLFFLNFCFFISSNSDLVNSFSYYHQIFSIRSSRFFGTTFGAKFSFTKIQLSFLNLRSLGFLSFVSLTKRSRGPLKKSCSTHIAR